MQIRTTNTCLRRMDSLQEIDHPSLIIKRLKIKESKQFSVSVRFVHCETMM